MKPLPRLILALGLLLATVPSAMAQEDLLAEKQTTERSIVVETVLEATPKEVFELWSSVEGVTQFFAPAARIEPKVGGRYEILFDPEGDPEGLKEGTGGARILKYEPDSFLAFEWRGRGYMTEMNTEPLPTWVELQIEAVSETPPRTRLVLTHQGFGTGGTWTHAYAFFQEAWQSVLGALEVHFAAPQTKLPSAQRASASLGG